MLKKVIIKNFGPVKKEVILSMEKGETEQYSENIIEETGLLKSIYIYGANNSGKSKVVESLKVLKEIVFEGKEVFARPYTPYLFSDEIDDVIHLDYYFLVDNIEYRYLINLDLFNQVIFKEEFFINNEIFFTRNKNIVNLNDHKIEDDIFYLTYYYSQIGNSEEIVKFVDYIKGIIFLDQQRESYLNIRRSSNSIKKISYLEKNLDELNILVKKFGFDFELIVLENPILGEKTKYIGAKRGERQLGLATLESFGTNMFIDLLLEIEQVKTSSQLIIIDEIERGIHFALVAGFINYINTKYPKKQLILPTHMTDLLESDLKIRKDQIYISTIIEDDGLKLERKFNKRAIRETMNFQKILKSKSVGGIPEILVSEVE